MNQWKRDLRDAGAYALLVAVFIGGVMFAPGIGRVLADAGVFGIAGSFNNSQFSFAAAAAVNSCDPGANYQTAQGSNYAAYGAAGCATADSNSTNHEAGGVFGSVRNGGTTTNAVGGTFYGLADGNGIDGDSDADRVRLWGINPLTSDRGFNHVYLTNEYDFNVTGDDTKVVGLSSAGASTHQLAPNSAWMVAGPVGSGVAWPTGYLCADGGAVVCVQIGPTSTGNNVSSQTLRLLSRNSGGGVQVVDIKAGPNGGVSINQPSGQAVMVQAAGVTGVWLYGDGTIRQAPIHQANLGTVTNGMTKYCDDCAPNSNPCAGFGSGAFAKGLAGQWDCRL